MKWNRNAIMAITDVMFDQKIQELRTMRRKALGKDVDLWKGESSGSNFDIKTTYEEKYLPLKQRNTSPTGKSYARSFNPRKLNESIEKKWKRVLKKIL